jgi:diadenylate cyclase
MWLWISTIIQVGVLACMFYYIFLFFKGTRGAQVLAGLGILMAILIILTQIFNLDALNWILRNLSVFLGVAVLVIFQPEIRRALAELGKQPLFSVTVERRTVIDNVVESVTHLAEHKIGALIAIERKIGTRSIQETGVKLDVPLIPDLLSCIFYPHTPLHDGGVIISGNRMMAAGCVFPLSHDVELHKTYGTRHRAAVGLSEETDAVLIVVSEETGAISVCYRGRLSSGMDDEQLKSFLSELLLTHTDTAWSRAQEELDLTPEGIAQSEEMEQEKKTDHE